MTERGRFSVRARLKSFTFALKGLTYLARREHNFQIHILIALAVIGLGASLQVSRAEWLWLVFAIASVLSAEATNTAIERMCDAVMPDHHPLIGIAKDVAAGMVLIQACAAGVIGTLVFVPYLVVL